VLTIRSVARAWGSACRVLFLAASLALFAGCQEDAEQPAGVDVVISGEESLQGVIECDRFVVVAGATVTASDDLEIHATEEIVIDGALVGAGVELLLTSDGSFVSHGEIRNLSNGSSLSKRVAIDARRSVALSGANLITDLPTSIRAGDFAHAEGIPPRFAWSSSPSIRVPSPTIRLLPGPKADLAVGST